MRIFKLLLLAKLTKVLEADSISNGQFYNYPHLCIPVRTLSTSTVSILTYSWKKVGSVKFTNSIKECEIAHAITCFRKALYKNKVLQLINTPAANRQLHKKYAHLHGKFSMRNV